MEHDAQPHQGYQHQLVKKEMGDHGKTPSSRWRNEGILPGFQAVGISRRLEVHDPLPVSGWVRDAGSVSAAARRPYHRAALLRGSPREPWETRGSQGTAAGLVFRACGVEERTCHGRTA